MTIPQRFGCIQQRPSFARKVQFQVQHLVLLYLHTHKVSAEFNINGSPTRNNINNGNPGKPFSLCNETEHLRYVFSDGKSITNFLINRIGQKETTWDNTMELVAWHTLVFCNTPFLWAQRRCFRFQVNRQFNGYLTIILVQMVAGGMTEASSIFVAVMGGGTVSIVSAWFGLYSLVMTTMLAVYRGNLVRKFGPNATVTSPAAARYGCCRALEGLSETLCCLIPAAVFGLGAFMVIMGITFFSTAGASSTEAWMLVVPGSVIAVLGWVSGQLLIRHYHSTSQAGMIIREEEPGV